MERRHLQDKEKMRKEHAAKIRETKMAMAQLAGARQHWTAPVTLAGLAGMAGPRGLRTLEGLWHAVLKKCALECTVHSW